MINTSKFVNQGIDLADFAANGAIGTAAATVDVSSSFTIAQTTASIVLTIPAPTVTTNNQVIWVANVGTVAVTVGGVSLEPNTGASFVYSSVNSVWNGVADVGLKKYYVQQTLAAGANVITHNLNLGTPKAVSVVIRDDATGQTVDIDVTAYAANTLTLSPLSAVALANITVLG